jgi:hypothetical protein
MACRWCHLLRPVLGAILITCCGRRQPDVEFWLVYGVLFIAMVTFALAGLTGILSSTPRSRAPACCAGWWRIHASCCRGS